MKVSAISSFGVKNCATKANNSTNNGTTTPTQEVKNKPNFAGFMSHAVNSSRKYIDYGDIFRPNTDFYSMTRDIDRYGKAVFRKAKKYFFDMTNSVFKNVNFEKSSLQIGDFSGSTFKNANFERTTLNDSKFLNTTMEDTSFENASLYGTKFDGAELKPGTNMQRTNLVFADFSRADVSRVDFIDAIYADGTKFPSGFDPQSEGMMLIQKGMNLSGQDMAKMKLRQLQFIDADMQRIKLKRADISKAEFKNCDMRVADLTRTYAKEADLSHCDLSGAKLKQLNLRKAYLNDVDMSNANLRGARLTWNSASSVNLRGAQYDQFTEFVSGFNPKSHGMEYIESPLSYYGL